MEERAPDNERELDEAFVHTTESGELRMWLAAPTVMVFKYKGHSDASYVDFLEEVVDRVFGSRGGLHFLVDCEEQTGFDAGFRRRITEWAKRLEPRTETYCLFARSRLVAFGIALVGLLVGGNTQVCTTRDAFRSKLEGAVRRSLADA
jgi:hypothetical protein